MKKIVLDTSIIVKWFNQEAGSEQAKIIYKQFQNQEIQIILPELVKYELGNALLKGKKITLAKVKTILINFYKLPFVFIEEDKNLSLLSYQIAEKHNMTYYDACFLALAKREKAVLITANPKHQKKTFSK